MCYNNFRSILDDLGRKEEAIMDFTKAIDIDQEDSKAYCNRG